MYVVTGYGSWDGMRNFSESFLILTPQLKLLDWFTPTNHFALDKRDIDLDSSGATLIPGTHLVLGGGKEGILYTLDARNLGHLGDEHAIVASTPRWRRRRSQMEGCIWQASAQRMSEQVSSVFMGCCRQRGDTDRGAEWREDLSSGRSCDANLEPCVRSTYLSRCPKQHAGAGEKTVAMGLTTPTFTAPEPDRGETASYRIVTVGSDGVSAMSNAVEVTSPNPKRMDH